MPKIRNHEPSSFTLGLQSALAFYLYANTSRVERSEWTTTYQLQFLVTAGLLTADRSTTPVEIIVPQHRSSV